MVTAQATAARLVQVLKAASRFRAARERQAWRTTHRVADAARPKFVSTLLLEMRDTRNKVNVARLSRAVASGNVTEIENALLLPKTDENLRRKYRRQIRDTLNEAGIKNVKLQPKVLAANFGRFDLTNPRAVRWAESKAATLVREITEGQRAVIRRVVAQGIQDGIPVSGTARRLRATVGLTVRQAEQVMRFQSTQIARGVPVDLATQRAERLSQKVLRRRAENIARTETIAASTQGRQELWGPGKRAHRWRSGATKVDCDAG